MATIDYPVLDLPAQFDWGIQKSGLQFSGPYNGTRQSIDFVAERWVLAVTLKPRRIGENTNARKALWNYLAGGVNRLRVWDMTSGTLTDRGRPCGTLRGAPIVRVAAVRGDAVLKLSNVTSGLNLFRNPSFELDGTADGVADYWAPYTAGTTGTTTFTLDASATAHGTRSQLIQAAGLGGGDGDRAGIFQTVTIGGGRAVTFSASVNARDTDSKVTMLVNFTGASGFISSATRVITPPTGTAFQRFELNATTPAGTTGADCYVYVHQRTGGAGIAFIRVDAAQFQVAPVASAFEPGATVLAGDMIKAGGQLFQAGPGGAVANAAGEIDVPLVNRVRAAIASGGAVQWDRPTADFIMPASVARHAHAPGQMLPGQFDLEEIW